jgi:hypothetical protein
MRVTVATTGEVFIETRDAAEAASFVRELRNGKTPQRRRRAALPKPKELESEDIPLSSALVDTWNWLVKHDDAEGCHSRDVAKGLGIQEHAVIYRLNKLVEKDLAHRTRPGRFRAGG